MLERFEHLEKISKEPAARILASVHAKLETPIEGPANTPVNVALSQLAEKEAWVDVLRLLSIALPAREAVWWACIAARDICEADAPTPCLKAAEAWVFEPTDENREKIRISLENTYVDDDTDLVATAALYAPGNMGTGDMAEYPAPAGAVSSCVFGMVMVSLSNSEDFPSHMQLQIDRALNIARNGNGQVEVEDDAPADDAVKEKGDA